MYGYKDIKFEIKNQYGSTFGGTRTKEAAVQMLNRMQREENKYRSGIRLHIEEVQA